MSDKKVLVIEGSARENSNTVKAVEKLCPYDEYETISLLRLKIHPYRYDEKYPGDDDFLTVARKMEHAEVIIFATSVYWFSMSSLMKMHRERNPRLRAAGSSERIEIVSLHLEDSPRLCRGESSTSFLIDLVI